MQEMKAKVAFGEDIRRWHYPSENRYQDLLSFIEKVFNLDGKSKSYYIQFEDAEMDKITISNERDLMDAFECAEQEQRQSLKIFVVAGSVTDTHESNSEPKEATNPTEAKSDECEEPERCEERERCDWQPLVLEFLLNENVRVLLPELVRRVIQVLREKAKNGEEVSLAVVVPLVLKEKTFENIVRNELYVKYADWVLPMLLSQASCLTHVLLALNEEAVGQWVSEMIDLGVASFAEGKDNGLWNMHMNMWCEEEKSGQTIHFNVACDICGMNPIQGIRYKCSVCPDYDLCEKCESSGQHHGGHPLLKINRPICRRQTERHHYAGLEEVVSRRHGGRHHMRPPCWMKFISNGMPFWGEERASGNREGCQRRWNCERRRRERDGNRHCGRHWRKHGKHNEAAEEKFEYSETLMCVCGAPLAKMTPLQAYGRTDVTCDWCGSKCGNDHFIYHCRAQSAKHPSGYDVCLRCVSSLPVEEPKEKEKEKKEKEKEKEKENVSEKVNEVEEEDKNEAVDPFDQFQYAKEARSLVEMGFTDVERVMYLLVSKKGDLSQVILELLPN